jgi:hypothetical protein
MPNHDQAGLPMTEVSLEFIAQQIERVLAEQRLMRNQLAKILDLLRTPGIVR